MPFYRSNHHSISFKDDVTLSYHVLRIRGHETTDWPWKTSVFLRNHSSKLPLKPNSRSASAILRIQYLLWKNLSVGHGG
ncbi:hypothetical protein SERLA73DRAFT_164322 [Serpula lacrymans var. lacrymans S7.3]|uniref:Uncharacterized protein n=1 Tax=Serpula lacrymans var. lacrymans (strain S7.3) TaxID=936435 RepID=F8QIJ5_SERL3|nr:hypothetical protein SERLA73DRAFT_164322 [Serpula lacrymans var. lacrymans S7.3]